MTDETARADRAATAAADEVRDVLAGLIPEDEVDPAASPLAHIRDRVRAAVLDALTTEAGP